jgi:hypothetical protein
MQGNMMTTTTGPETSDLQEEQQARNIAVEAYIYLCPLVNMDVFRRLPCCRRQGSSAWCATGASDNTRDWDV